MTFSLGTYGKFITAIVGQALTYVTAHYAGQPWIAIVVAAAAALGVYAVPNSAPKPPTLPPVPPAGQ